MDTCESVTRLYRTCNPFRGKMSSLSKNVSHSPLALLMPVFLACERPWFNVDTTLILESTFANSLAISRVLSVEPSLTTIASKSVKVCARTLSRHSRMYSCALYAGIIIEIEGFDIKVILALVLAFATIGLYVAPDDAALGVADELNDFIALFRG